MINIYKKSINDKSPNLINEMDVGSWVCLTNPSPEELNKVSESLNVDIEFLKASLDDDEKPRVEIDKEVVSVIFRVPYKKDDLLKVIPVNIIITPKNIVTVSLVEVNVLSDFYTKYIADFFTTKKTRFVIQILSKSNYYIQKHLNEIEKKLNLFESSLLKSYRNEEVIELLKLQKSLVYMNTAVIANNKVLQKILTGKSIKLYREDEDVLEDILIDNEQSIESIKVYGKLLGDTLNAYASIVSNNLNMVMKLLTIITLVISIPTVIASIYGMNLDLPLQSVPYAFYYIILISISLMLLMTFVLYRKKYF